MTHTYSTQKGITLINLALFIVAIGFFISTFLFMKDQYDAHIKMKVTQERTAAISEALMAFKQGENRLPEPASMTAAPEIDEACFGREYTVNSCGGVETIANNTDIGTLLVDNTVLIGAVPVRSLGLPDKFIVDGYGKRFRYAITTYFTDETTADFAKGVGAIDIRDPQGNQIGSAPGQLIYALVAPMMMESGEYDINGQPVGGACNHANCIQQALIDNGIEDDRPLFTQTLVSNVNLGSGNENTAEFAFLAPNRSFTPTIIELGTSPSGDGPGGHCTLKNPKCYDQTGAEVDIAHCGLQVNNYPECFTSNTEILFEKVHTGFRKCKPVCNGGKKTPKYDCIYYEINTDTGVETGPFPAAGGMSTCNNDARTLGILRNDETRDPEDCGELNCVWASASPFPACASEASICTAGVYGIQARPPVTRSLPDCLNPNDSNKAVNVSLCLATAPSESRACSSVDCGSASTPVVPPTPVTPTPGCAPLTYAQKQSECPNLTSGGYDASGGSSGEQYVDGNYCVIERLETGEITSRRLIQQRPATHTTDPCGTFKGPNTASAPPPTTTACLPLTGAQMRAVCPEYSNPLNNSCASRTGVSQILTCAIEDRQYIQSAICYRKVHHIYITSGEDASVLNRRTPILQNPSTCQAELGTPIINSSANTPPPPTTNGTWVNIGTTSFSNCTEAQTSIPNRCSNLNGSCTIGDSCQVAPACSNVGGPTSVTVTRYECQ